MNGFEGLSVEEFFELSDVVRTRGHSKKKSTNYVLVWT